jgi:aspartyl-tRNA synthetase
MPDFATQYRTHTCGELRATHIPPPPAPGQKQAEEPPLVLLCGHVADKPEPRSIVVRDRYGSTLVTVADDAYPYVAERFEKLDREEAVQVGGRVGPRLERDPENPTGEVRLLATKIEVLGRVASPPPDGLMTDARVKFEDRLANRDYYLRRPDMQKRLAYRAKLAHEIREYFNENGFVEMETPHLFWYDSVATSGEVIPNGRGRAWRTSSGPVVLDQYIIAGQFERSFQFNRITRNEELRDFTEFHQQEHVGLDINMSYVDMPDFCKAIEDLLVHVFKACKGVDLPTPFPCMTEEEALLKYGSEKPDTRFDLHIVDLPAAAKKEGVACARAFCAPGGAKIEDKVIEPIAERLGGAAKVSWVRIDNLKKLTGPATAVFTDPLFHDTSKYRESLLGSIGAKAGDLVFIATAPKERDAAIAAGRARVAVAKQLGLGKGEHRPVWVHGYTFLEEYKAHWNPRVIVFASAAEEDEPLLDFPEKRMLVRSKTFDLVLDGEEISSGYVGCHSLRMQKLVWDRIWSIQHQDLYRVRAPIESHRFGVPPHAGMNLGFDRLVALMLGVDAIDEVMHFPKDARCADLFLGAPGPVPPEAVLDLVADERPPAELTLETMNQEVVAS